MKATVLGGQGFIGGHLVSHLRSTGGHCWVPGRDDPEVLRRELGSVFYCVGLTADFRARPFATIDAHAASFTCGNAFTRSSPVS